MARKSLPSRAIEETVAVGMLCSTVIHGRLLVAVTTELRISVDETQLTICPCRKVIGDPQRGALLSFRFDPDIGARKT